MTRTSRVAATLAVLLLGPGARAQPPDPANLRGDSPQTRKRLSEAEQKVIGGKAIDAIDDLQRILDEAGDDLVTVDGKQFRPARWVAHQLLAKFPADALKAYQGRIEEPARKLLDAGTRDRDPRPLWNLLDRYYVSRPGGEALLVLGDLLFERGEFRTAELMWRRLLPDGGADIPHPTPKADPAAVRARLVIAAVFQGEADRAKAELATLKAKHPNAAGPIAGKTGPYADTLQPSIDQPPPLPPDGAGGTSWPTFGGGPGRTGRVAGRLPNYWPSRPAWVTPIPQDSVPFGPAPLAPPVRPPFGHPVIADGRVYVTNGDRFLSFQLHTGQSSAIAKPADSRAPGPATACTLTVAGGHVYARLGLSVIRPPDATVPRQKADEPVLACFAPDRDDPPLKRLWRLGVPATDAKVPAAWEGAPLVVGGKMWAALARFDGGRVVHALACYDPADPEAAPEQAAWVAEVSDSPLSLAAEGRGRHELLTLAGRNVVFGSNAGAVVALDAATGRRAWGFKYPRAARRSADAGRSPDPAPAVAYGGRVFVAPADGDRVYALDAETGALLWESGPVEGSQILGIARGRVILTTTGPLRGIRALGVRTGSYRDGEGWVQSDGGGLLGYGRGLVSDDAILWPTREGLLFLDPDTGRPLSRQNPLRAVVRGQQTPFFGNLAYADGVLVVVTPTDVWGFVPEANRIVSADAARVRFEATVDDAERRLAAGDPRGRESLLKLAGGDLPPRFRAWAAARLLLLNPPVDAAEKLPADVRLILRPDLDGEWLVAPGGELVTLGGLAARHTGREPAPGSRLLPPTLPARKARDAPTLAADACIDRTVRMPPHAVPLWPIPGTATPAKHLFAATGPQLFTFTLDAGEKGTRPAPEAFTHAADLATGFVAAGPFAVALYGGRPEAEWVFRVPETDPLPQHVGRVAIRGDDEPDVPRLSSFALAGSTLFARLGERHLLAFDLRARRVAWVLGAHGQYRFEPAALPGATRFEPHLFASPRLVAVQLSDGRRWLLRSDTGRAWDHAGGAIDGPIPAGHGEPTARVPWVYPPVEVDAGRVAFSDGPGLVRFHRLSEGKVKSVYEAEGESSLSGEPPQVRAWGAAVFVAVRRNHGVELDRVELTDGKSLWVTGPAFLDAERVSLEHADADVSRVYVPTAGKLFAFALADGKPAWEAELPRTRGAGGWVVRAGRNAAIAYRETADPAEPVGAVRDRIGRSFLRRPDVSRLPGLGGTLYDAWVERTVPVLLFDPETGRLCGQCDVPARGPIAFAMFEGTTAVVATGDRICWLK